MYSIFEALIKEKGLKAADVSRGTGLPSSFFSEWKRGKSNPKYDKLQKIAAFLEVTPEYLMTGEGPRTSPAPAAAAPWPKIPVYGRVTAGDSRPMFFDYVEDVSIDPETYDRYGAALKGVRVSGDSMAPRIRDGDTLIIHPQPDAENGEIVIVTTNGDDAMCKRLKKYADGIQLISDNPAYPPMTFSNEELNSLPVTIIGKVVRLIGDV